MLKRRQIIFRLTGLILSLVFFSQASFASSGCKQTFEYLYRSHGLDVQVISHPLVKKLHSEITKISPNKTKALQELSSSTCGLGCLSLSSKSSVSFRIELKPSIQEPELLISAFEKLLILPSWDMLENTPLLKSWLIGHELHPQMPSSLSETIVYSSAQQKAFQAVKIALKEGASSLLHISPTGTGKSLVLAQAVRENLKEGLHFVSAHQIHLVEQLNQSLQESFSDKTALVINWNDKANKTFVVEIKKAMDLKQAVVFVITTQSLKRLLEFMEKEEPESYKKLVEHTKGIYLDEAHHLGAFHTKSVLTKLHKQSGAFFYGSTATPVHHEINLRDLFEKEHWSYLEQGLETGVKNRLNEQEGLFRRHKPEIVLNQLSTAIKKGELIPFEELYIIGEVNFPDTAKEPLFIQTDSNLFVLNSFHYNHLAGILHPLVQSNKKGFIVTASIAEAERLSQFLSEVFKDIEFEPYHSGMGKEEREEVLRNSKEKEKHYIVAVRALDEGVNGPQLSAYIDLNANVSVKQMVHRIGRVLRLYPGKLGADILFLSDYRDERRARDLLSLLDLWEASPRLSRTLKRSFSGDVKLNQGEVKSLSREALLELRTELEASVQSFWNKENSLSIITERKEKILALMKEKPQIKIAEIAKALGMNRSSINTDIKELKEEERLLRVGGRSHDGYWQIPEKEKVYTDPREERKEKILALMKEKPQIKIAEIAKALGMSTRSIRNHIKQLKEEGRLLRMGGSNSNQGYWQIPEEGKIYTDPVEERKEKILALVKENPQITIPEIAKALGVSLYSIRNHIKELKEEGRLLRMGTKNGYWELNFSE